MEMYFLKTNILAIIFCGVTMAMLGFFVLLFKDLAAPNMRYFLPIPPIGVAAYVFVFNMFRKYDGHLPGSFLKVLTELSIATFASAAFFLIFSACLTTLIFFMNSK